MFFILLSRQPIFDRTREVVGYELIFRSDASRNATSPQTPESVNAAIVAEAAAGRKAFVNLTRDQLLNKNYSAFPSGSVIEIGRNVAVDDAVIAACKELKSAKFLLSLGDFVIGADPHPLLESADYLRVDLLTADTAARRTVVETCGGRNAALLAAKVETHQDFQEACDLGYNYFQGYFFCKPQIMSGRALPAFKQNYVRFIQEVNRTPMNYDELETIIKSEASLASKLLRYLNSAAVGLRQKMTSIKQAISLLGEGPLRKWASLAALNVLSDDKPPQLLATCLARARFCELIAPKAGLLGRELDAFMLGLFSAMDGLTDQPLDLVISDIPVAADVSAALMGENTLLGKTYRLVLAMERGNGPFAQMIATSLQLPMTDVSSVYRQSLQWADRGTAQSLAA